MNLKGLILAANEFLGVSPDFPIFSFVPLVVFGPVFVLVLYNLGLKHIINPSAEVKEQNRLRKADEARETAERKQKMDDAGMKMKATKKTPLQLLGQGATFAVFALVISYFSTSPAYVAHPPEKALLKLSMTHAGKHVQECKKRSREELAKLAANMRAPMDCSRERWPVIVDLALDGERIFTGSATPTGLSKDGHSSFYEGFPVVTGVHTISVGVWDSKAKADSDDFDYVLKQEVNLKPQEILVISFDNAAGRITLE
ncbi:MAG: hypothetical protein ISR45_01930 [Rhodospirillales bacterium]|nr:hypothetical protein [Rhodospirillales bacterium]